jgi:hypothetical protein
MMRSGIRVSNIVFGLSRAKRLRATIEPPDARETEANKESGDKDTSTQEEAMRGCIQ